VQKTQNDSPLPDPPAARGAVDDDVLDMADFAARVDELALDQEGGRAEDAAGRGVCFGLEGWGVRMTVSRGSEEGGGDEAARPPNPCAKDAIIIRTFRHGDVVVRIAVDLVEARCRGLNMGWMGGWG
jgi:hypothetical protein